MNFKSMYKQFFDSSSVCIYFLKNYYNLQKNITFKISYIYLLNICITRCRFEKLRSTTLLNFLKRHIEWLIVYINHYCLYQLLSNLCLSMFCFGSYCNSSESDSVLKYKYSKIKNIEKTTSHLIFIELIKF